MFTRKLALICALACAASAAAPRVAKAGDPPWVRVTSANFVVYSDAGEKRARAVSERLESFRALMASLFPAVVRAAHTDQVPVVAFRSDDDFKPFKPLYNGKPAHAAGVFLQAAEQGMMALDVTAWEGSSHVIFHEYIHRLLARRDRPVPIWFDEGVAELYSMAVARGTKAEIGRIVPGQIELLRERGLMPLDRLFAVGRDSPEYNELNKQTVFYAESWLLVHYVTLDKDQTRASALTQFAERVGNGEEPATAFKAAFGIDTAAMDKELKKYLFQLTVPFTSYTFEAPETAEARVEVAPPSEVEYYLGNTLAFQARFDEAKARYERAAEADKASPLPYEGLCFLGVLRGDMPGVRAAYAEAVKRGSQSFYTHYYFAAASIAAGDTHSPAVRASLEKAVEINPEFADAYARLADLAIGRGDVTAARSWAERGLKIEPSNTRMLGALANADIREAKYDEARKLLTRVAAEA
ncbi:MAG TPA: hypothetical protein VLJ38_18205, partial [Polyangiaceae bacterium]|nr:hypothetical protein [Polyangiaceae bacterium]